MTDSPRILALHAHPDDIEFQCAGTLLLLRRRGLQVFLATMTPGDCGSAEHSRSAIAAIRRREAMQSAELLGAEYTCLEFRDLEIVRDNPSRKRVTEFLRRTRPDVVLTAPPDDYLADHEITSQLVRDALFNASVPNYHTGATRPAAPLRKIPYLYYVDSLEGMDALGRPRPAEFHVDVSSVFEQKRAMLACHASQREWLLRQHGIDEYLAAQERWGAERGREIGVPYAEGFVQHRGHPFPRDNRLLELLR